MYARDRPVRKAQVLMCQQFDGLRGSLLTKASSGETWCPYPGMTCPRSQAQSGSKIMLAQRHRSNVLRSDTYSVRKLTRLILRYLMSKGGSLVIGRPHLGIIWIYQGRCSGRSTVLLVKVQLQLQSDNRNGTSRACL